MYSRAFHLVILILCLLLIGVSYVFTLNEIGMHFFGLKWPIHCFLKHTFGIKCAFCGMTRSFMSMAHGEFSQAFGFHPIGPVLFGLVALQIPYRLWALMIHPKKLPLSMKMLHKLAIGLTITLIFVYWLMNLYASVMK